MKRRLCSRRFIGQHRRHRGLAQSWPGFREASQDDSDDGHSQTAAPNPEPRRRIRLRLMMAAGLVLLSGFLVAAFTLPTRSQERRFPGDRFATPSLDQLIWWESFSEVEQTKGILRGLGLQAIAEIRRSYLRSRPDPAAAADTEPSRAVNPRSVVAGVPPAVEPGVSPGGHNAEASSVVDVAGSPAIPTTDPSVMTAIARVRYRLEEFEGTEYTTFFQGELLRLLRKAGLHTEWLDLYLELTYRQPGDALIVMEAPRAAEAAKATGREDELHDALDHWNRIPSQYRPHTAGFNPLVPQPVLP